MTPRNLNLDPKTWRAPVNVTMCYVVPTLVPLPALVGNLQARRSPNVKPFERRRALYAHDISLAGAAFALDHQLVAIARLHAHQHTGSTAPGLLSEQKSDVARSGRAGRGGE